MKKIVLILFTFSIIVSCSNDDSITIDNEIVGTWKVIGFMDDIDDPDNIYDVMGTWEPVENGRFVELKPNGQFTNIYGCNLGNFHLEGDKFFFSCQYEGNDTPSNIQGLHDIDENGILTLSVGFVSERMQRVSFD